METTGYCGRCADMVEKPVWPVVVIVRESGVTVQVLACREHWRKVEGQDLQPPERPAGNPQGMA